MTDKRTSERALSDELRAMRDFIGTRMNHPKESSSELKAERPGFMDLLRDAADRLERLEYHDRHTDRQVDACDICEGVTS